MNDNKPEGYSTVSISRTEDATTTVAFPDLDVSTMVIDGVIINGVNHSISCGPEKPPLPPVPPA